jgi:putative radical SAM enzyme (TIGR03279 family)
VHELARLYPAVPTTAVVPVGLTRHRERLPALRPVTVEEAGLLVRTIEGWQDEFRASLGTRFVWAADELYLQSGIALPPARAYEGFAVAEDGIGLVRRFEDGFARALAHRPARLERPRRVTVVTGEMFAPRMRALLDRLTVEGLSVSLVPVANEFFGRGIGVVGLLTGRDIQLQLAGRELGDVVLVPAVALRDGAGVFLDDLTPADLSATLGTPVSPVEPDAPALLTALLGR